MRRRTLLTASMAALVSPARADPRLFGRGSWTELLAAHAGKPAIFHFWGLTCGPCLAELPDWGKLPREADLVMIAADPVPQPPDQLAATLARAGLSDAESWSFDGRFPSRLFFEVDPVWQGELPRTTLRTAGGAQTAWIGAADFSRVRDWLDRQRT